MASVPGGPAWRACWFWGQYDLRVREVVRGPSRTAVLTAVARALHREEPRPWVIDDYLALGLAGREGRALLGRCGRRCPGLTCWPSAAGCARGPGLPRTSWSRPLQAGSAST